MKYFQKYGLYLLFVFFAFSPNKAESASYAVGFETGTNHSETHSSLSKEKNVLFSYSFLISDNITLSFSHLPNSTHTNSQNKNSAKKYTSRNLVTNAQYFISVQHKVRISLPPYDIIYPFHSFW